MKWGAAAAAFSVCVVAAIAAPVLRHPSTMLFGAESVGRHHDPFTVIEQYRRGAIARPYLQPATDAPGIVLATSHRYRIGRHLRCITRTRSAYDSP